MTLVDKWNSQTLKQWHILAWLQKQTRIEDLMKVGLLTDEDVEHVAICIHHIFLWYHGKRVLGHFLTAVVKNDFGQACGRADTANSYALPLYAIYLYNHAPRDYNEKAIAL